MPARAKLPPGEGKRVPLNMRTTREVREKLEKAAADSGRSLTQQVEYQIEQFQRGDDHEQAVLRMFGLDPDSFLAWRCLSDAISKIEQQTGKSWREDWDAGQQIQAAFKAIVKTFGAKRPVENRLTEKGRLRSEIRKNENVLAGHKAAGTP